VEGPLDDAGPVFTDEPRWRLAAALAVGAALMQMVALPTTSAVMLATACIHGPLQVLLRLLPDVKSQEDFRVSGSASEVVCVEPRPTMTSRRLESLTNRTDTIG